jgi:hypothetical protein
MQRRLARDITVAMAIKLVLLVVLFALLARPGFRPASDAVATAAAVAGPEEEAAVGQ